MASKTRYWEKKLKRARDYVDSFHQGAYEIFCTTGLGEKVILEMMVEDERKKLLEANISYQLSREMLKNCGKDVQEIPEFIINPETEHFLYRKQHLS